MKQLIIVSISVGSYKARNSSLISDKLSFIEDLYRLGFLGNFMPISKIYRWQHKGDERKIIERLTLF